MPKNPNSNEAGEPGTVVVHIETADPTEDRPAGLQDEHVAGVVVTHTEPDQRPTAAEYRAKGYGIDPDLPDDAIPHFIQSDSYGEPLSVVLEDGKTVTGDDIPTAAPLKTRRVAKTPDDVSAEAKSKSDNGKGPREVPVQTAPTPAEAVQEAGKAKAANEASKDADKK